MNDRHLTLKALEMALKRRCPDAGLLHHSDQGCTYASEDYQALLDAHGITCCMSRRGNCYDNAVMESFFSTVKSEIGDRFDSCGEPRWSCSTTSRCSITSGADIRRSGRSVRPNSNDARAKRAWMPWKTAKNAVSHRAPHPSPVSSGEEQRPERDHASQPSTESDHAQGSVARSKVDCP